MIKRLLCAVTKGCTFFLTFCVLAFLVLGCAGQDQSEIKAHNILYELDYSLQQSYNSELNYLRGVADRSWSLTSVAECTKYLDTEQREYRHVSLGIVSPSGEMICSSPRTDNIGDFAGQSHIQRALQTKTTSLGDYYASVFSGKPALGYAYPVSNGAGELVGVVFSEVDGMDRYGFLEKRMLADRSANNGELLILDSQGRILLRTPVLPESLGISLATTPLGRAMLSQNEGTMEAAGADGVTRTYAYMTPKWTQGFWHLAVGVKK